MNGEAFEHVLHVTTDLDAERVRSPDGSSMTERMSSNKSLLDLNLEGGAQE